MSTYLFRLGRWSFRHRRVVLGLWLVVVVAAVLLGTLSGGKTNDTFTIPGTESQRTADLLKRTMPALAGGQTQLVLAAPAQAKITDPGPKAGVEAALAQVRGVPQVASAADPYPAGISPDGQVALVTVQWTDQPADVKDSSLDALKAAVVPAQQAGDQVEYSGSVFPGWRLAPSELPEVIGLAVAFLVLLVTFGSLVAAGLPILTAILGVAVTLMTVTALAAITNIASTSTTVAIMLGLSCGIDYGLFILFRHRNQVLQGMPLEDSAALAVGTAGGSVVFAALTVIIALCGMAVVGIPFLTVMGLAGAGAVAMALLIALTLLPALLGFAGRRITVFVSTRLRPGHHERVAKTSAAESPHTLGARWARFVVRYRIWVSVVGVGLLVVLALPAFSMELGLPSGASQPTSKTQRRAYDLISNHFGPGYNGPLLVVTETGATPAAVQGLAAALTGQPDVAAAVPIAANPQVAIVQVIPRSGPDDPATAGLVHGLRDNRAAIEATVGTPVLIGGTTASNIDVSQKLSDALPVFLVVVVGLAFFLLTLAFRTILVPIKSIIGFLLSVAAAFGAQVAMFQWGWGRHLFNITPTETISFLPLIMLAIIFGLSSDYEVFVVSRIKEDFTAHGDARGAVEHGTARSARVVTAAALIMFSIFVAFMFTSDPIIKAIGFSFATGVFLDAFVVRLTVVPAVMAIIGARIWYHPDWFARYVPDPDIEGTRLEEHLGLTPGEPVQSPR
ncbi:MMPL family transporter [Kitasatospora sp. NPDC002227]|uniref:MMPL family transporter n=1 Tax=Kitasatospora sp. NPDC002227 TaxID=3154773 RepID=UPI00332D66B8